MAIEKFGRYLTSQHFGRVVATVSFSTDSGGIVQLSLLGAGGRIVQFSFAKEVSELLSNSAEDWHELVIRLAVFQTHKRLAKNMLHAQSQVLDVEGALWLGDLLLAPYGGATAGVEMRRQMESNKHSSR